MFCKILHACHGRQQARRLQMWDKQFRLRLVLPLLVLTNFLSSYSNWEVITVKFSHLTKCMGVCLKRKKVTSRLMVFFLIRW